MYDNNPTSEELLRRKQVVLKNISELVDQAKALLADANQMALDTGMSVEFSDMLSDITSNVNNTWYASDTSQC